MDELGRLREALALAGEQRAGRTLEVELTKAQNRQQQQHNNNKNQQGGSNRPGDNVL